nr:hypothetical protein [Escherichia coli O25b:H4-ST131]
MVNGDAEYKVCSTIAQACIRTLRCTAGSSDEGTDMPSNGGGEKRRLALMSVFLAEERN